MHTTDYKTKLVSALCSAMLIMSLAFATITHAAGNILYLSPDQSQVNLNSSIAVNVRGYVETAGSTGTVSGTLTYPTNILRVTNITFSDSSYNTPSISQGNGTVRFSASKSPGPTGQVRIFTVTFQAIGSGKATVGFSGDSNLNQTTTNLRTGTFTVPSPPAPAPTPTPTPKPTPAPTPTPAPAPTPTPTPVETPATNPAPVEGTPSEEAPDTTGLITSPSSIAGYTSASISWKLSSDGTTEFAYGNSSTELTKKPLVNKDEQGFYSATLVDLQPGQRYYFTITGTGADGRAGTYTGSVSTKGYPVKITITQGGSPTTSATIKIGQQVYGTSRDGIVTLSLAEGSYTGTVAAGDSSQEMSFTVAKKPIPDNGNAPEQQSFSFDLPATEAPSTGVNAFVFIGVIVVGSALLAMGFFVYVTVRRRRFETGPGYNGTSSTPTVVIDDGYDWEAERLKALASASSPTMQPTTATETIGSHHANSVYINEEEPKDMFELAKEQAPQPAPQMPVNPIESPISNLNDWPQNPNLPHSTRP